MKKKRKIILFLSVALIFTSFVTVASAKQIQYNDDIRFKASIFTPFIITALRKESSWDSDLKSFLLIGTHVTVINKGEVFSQITTANGDSGYVLSIWLNIKDDLTLSRTYEHVYCGTTELNRLTATSAKNRKISWSTSDNKYVLFDQSTGNITGLTPGITTVTARSGLMNKSCSLVSINRWENTWKTTVDATIIYTLPISTSTTVTSIPSGTSVNVKGDMLGNEAYIDWLYIECNGKWGFINRNSINNFEGLLTVYNYYDNGYTIRFSDPKNKITDYYSSASTILWKKFGLKVNFYISPYISLADKCKSWSYGQITSSNISYLSCPKTGSHNSASCLTTTHMRDQLLIDKGYGTTTITRALWTGHIMNNHANSNSEIVTQTLVFTTGNTVIRNSNGAYINASANKIRRDSIFEAVHETCHQLGVPDHYCYNDTVPCSNKYCSKCALGLESYPDCIMTRVEALNVNSLSANFCDECKDTISLHINDHH